MTPNELKNKVVEAFDSADVLTSLEVDASSFCELPRLFESSHLSMRIMLNDQAAMAVASSSAAKLKSDLQQVGVELEYSIITQWKVLRFSPTSCNAAKMVAGCLPSPSISSCNRET